MPSHTSKSTATSQADGAVSLTVNATLVWFSGTGALHAFEWTGADLEEVERRLAEVAAFVRADRPWAEVEHEVVSGPVSRPCDECGYHMRGCRGILRDRTPVRAEPPP